jgi:regulator of nonsense transcripts 2
MPDVGTELVAAVGLRITYTLYAHTLQLDEEFRYLQRKKNVVVELAEVRLKVYSSTPASFFPCSNETQNITFISSLTKFKVVPPHLILHMFKVCIDEFSGTNIDNLALLLEGCGRFLLRNDETKQRFGTMVRRVAQSSMSATNPWHAARAHEAQAESSPY